MHVRLDLETLSTVTKQTAQAQSTSWEEFLRDIASHHQNVEETLNHTHQQVDERISRVEEMLKTQSTQIQNSQFLQVGPSYNMGPPASRRRLSRSVSKERPPKMPSRPEAVGVRLTQYASICRAGCLCACHSQTKSSTTSGCTDSQDTQEGKHNFTPKRAILIIRLKFKISINSFEYQIYKSKA